MITRRNTVFALGALAATPALAAIQHKMPVTRKNPLDVVNPELRPAASQMMAMIGAMPQYSREALPAMRANAVKWAKPPLATVPWEKRLVPGAPGNPAVTLYCANVKPGRRRGAILYMHGGGYVGGGAFFELDRAQSLAVTLDCVVISVEYRLAPETTFTGSLEDNYAALSWLYRNASELGVDRSRIVLLGESAGGGHAALLAVAARDRGEVPVAMQCLVYPMLDDRTGTTRAVPGHIGAIGWDSKANAFGWHSFLGRRPGGPGTAGVPGRVASVNGLPPTWIGVGSIDLFVDEDMDYARRLLNAAIPTELVVVPGAFHGFDLIAADTQIAKRFTETKIGALKRALG